MSSAPNLRELQKWIKSVVTDPRGVEEALRGPDDGTMTSSLSWIITNKVSSEERLNVYGEAYFFRILECMEKDFPRTAKVLGEKLFSYLVSQYLKAHPSTSYSIDEVGSQFAEFISDQSQDLLQPWVKDLVSLEWSLIESFYAPECQIEPAPQPTDSEMHQVTFDLHPSVRLLEFKWALPEIIKDIEIGELKEEPTDYARPTFMIIYRDQDFHSWYQVSEPIFKTIHLLQSEFTLEEATAHLEEEHAQELSEAFYFWIKNRILIERKQST